MPKSSTFLVALAMGLLSVSSFSEDLGVIGPTYRITEQDLIGVLQGNLRRMERSGELARVQEDYKRKVVAGIERPRPVVGIKPTQISRTHYIDPTWALDRPVQDERGAILYPAGTRVNPLDYERMTKLLLFFDGRDKAQLAFALRVMQSEKMPVKPILVGGEPLSLMRKWQREVFFDQGGSLSKRFNITQTPAVVRQEGRQLRVDEIKL